MNELKQALGYRFVKEELLSLALTHPSVVGRENNQRLEFLGDAVLEFCVSDLLYRKYPDWQEGALTERRIALVREETLAQLARELGVSTALVVGPGAACEAFRTQQSVLCDTFEAVLAAVYLDGGMKAAYHLVARLFKEDERLAAHRAVNAKGELQTLTQQRGLGLPVYELLSSQNLPDNRWRFVMRVLVQGEPLAQGEGGTKQAAEQSAAQRALERLQP